MLEIHRLLDFSITWANVPCLICIFCYLLLKTFLCLAHLLSKSTSFKTTPLTSRKFFMAAQWSFPLFPLNFSSPNNLSHSPYHFSTLLLPSFSRSPLCLSLTHTHHIPLWHFCIVSPHFPFFSWYSTDPCTMQHSIFVTLNCDCLFPPIRLLAPEGLWLNSSLLCCSMPWPIKMRPHRGEKRETEKHPFKLV